MSSGISAGLLLRVRTYLTRRNLDRELADGADPDTSAALRMRADQLRSIEGRARIADRLQRVLDEAHAPSRLHFVLRPHRAEIRARAPELQDLIERLRSSLPITPRGAAMSARLVTRGESPFDPNRRVSVGRGVQAAREALDETEPTEELGLAA
jgi:hypothetical protein